ncbi:MAG: HAMP domain-containing histidine kinase [Verrucomicrobia bacterium]|nr:HAMP domain-containing histidine kinase [Verrucomicrobiota bacterium]
MTANPNPTPGLTLPLLRRLRWTAVVGQATAVAVTVWLLRIPLPLLPVALCLGVTILTNLGLHRLSPGQGERPEQLTAVLALDVALLTVLLYFTGGPHNPFTSFYLVHVALAAVALPLKPALLISAECCLGYAMLFLGQAILPRPGDAVCGIGPNLPLALHLKGMLVAFVLTAASIAGFVGRLQQAWRRGEAELAAARLIAAQNDRFAALATLAGGAAHELGTPLGTIGIAASELTRAAARHPEDAELAEDAHLIAEEVQRCRLILNRLGNPAGDPPEPLSLGEVLKEVGARFERAPLIIQPAPTTAHLVAPRQALVQALSSLVKNALDASPAGSPVHLNTHWKEPVVEFQVLDHGCGLTGEVANHAGEPFYTTKPPGQGVGLGLFLVRLLAQRLGGDFSLRSSAEGGAQAILRLPRVPPGVAT